MADKSAQLVLNAISRAALAPNGTPLFGNRSSPGLFSAGAAARQAAQRARDDGLIHCVASDPNAKSDRDLYAATERGLAFLVQHSSPKQVLEDVARTIDSRQNQFTEMLGIARRGQEELSSLRLLLERLAPSAGANETHAEDWLDELPKYLSEWSDGGAIGDCPLPDLFRELRARCPSLTIGQFHDGLRMLHNREQVHLHPWTGPLYAMPAPALALLIGHEIAYYVSLRSEFGLIDNQRRARGYRTEPVALPATTR